MWNPPLIQPAAALLLSGASNPIAAGARSTATASGTLTTGIQLVSSAIAVGVVATALTTSGPGLASDAVVRATSQTTLTTGFALSSAASASSTGTANLAYVPTYVDLNHAGSNVDSASIVITNADTLTPTIRFSIRTPDDAEWQQYLAWLRNVRGKTPTIEVAVAGKESDPDTYLGTYQGPWWSPTVTADTWTLISGPTLASGYWTYSFSPGNNNDVYIASIPPLTQDVALAWMQSLATDYPTLIHDDLPSRVALADGPYICARSGTGRDENARTVTNLPMYGFRIGNDSLGTAPKRRVVVFCGVHSGEWNGFHMLKGFADEVLAGTFSTALLTNFDFYIYPLHSILGNYLGFRRNEATPSASNYDSNREWADGDTTVPTVVKWQQVLDTDHGVNHASKVVYYTDFHDGKKTSAKVWYYYYPGFPDQAAYQTLVAAQNSNIAAEVSDVNGTTQEYWYVKGVTFSFNPEVADEQSTLTELEGYGAAYARSIKTANDANMLNVVAGYLSSATSTSQASATLTTGVQLQAAARSTSVANAVLTVTPNTYASDAAARVASQAALTTAILMVANSQAAARVTAVLVDPDAGEAAHNITHRSVTPFRWSISVRV